MQPQESQETQEELPEEVAFDDDGGGGGGGDFSPDEELEEPEESKQTNAISRIIAEGGTVVRRPESSSGGFPVFRLLFLLFAVLPSAWFGLLPYKADSASIGYCDAGKATNDVLEGFRAKRAAIEACNRENRTTLYVLPAAAASGVPDETREQERDEPECPYPPLMPAPDSCTPCPEHATCTAHSVECNSGYIIRLHPLLSLLPIPVTNSTPVSQDKISAPVKAILDAVSVGLDGMPGMGSVALPPRCVVDPRRRRHIGVLGKAIESALGQERGRRLCAGDPPLVKEEDGGEAKRWGIEVAKLKERTKRNISVRAGCGI